MKNIGAYITVYISGLYSKHVPGCKNGCNVIISMKGKAFYNINKFKESMAVRIASSMVLVIQNHDGYALLIKNTLTADMTYFHALRLLLRMILSRM